MNIEWYRISLVLWKDARLFAIFQVSCILRSASNTRKFPRKFDLPHRTNGIERRKGVLYKAVTRW